MNQSVRDSAVIVMLTMAHIPPRGAETLQVLSCLFPELAAASRQRDLESAMPSFGQAPLGAADSCQVPLGTAQWLAGLSLRW